MTQAGAIAALRIRSCGPQHAGELARLHASLFDEGWDAASFRELLAHPGAIAFAACPVGIEIPPPAWGFILGRVAADEAEVLALGVARERQRLGVGTRLVERLCRAADGRGARRVHLEVAEGNAAARVLYARLGFEESGRRPGYYVRADAPAEDAINLCLTIPGRRRAGRSGGRVSERRL
jgi:[ribosomal protein S18]-alanine N-acetyltransferase